MDGGLGDHGSMILIHDSRLDVHNRIYCRERFGYGGNSDKNNAGSEQKDVVGQSGIGRSAEVLEPPQSAATGGVHG